MMSTVKHKVNKTEVGHVIGKRYRIVEALSAGGMSQTFLAEDISSSISGNCVVKKLSSATDGSEAIEKTRRLFEKEAQTLEKLGHHDQIPSLLAYFEEDDDFYLVQEFIVGHPLTHEMPLGERWSEEQTKNFLEEFLDVLSYIHSQNVIHLDIKPANIIRRQQDQKLVLIDFGAVKQVNLQPTAQHHELGKTQSTVLTCIGTKGYMPTEQAIGRPHLSSDIYALGMTAIQALTGILPFQLREDDEGEISWRNQAEVSDRLADILTKMVRRFHKQRYQSAAEVSRCIKGIDGHSAQNSVAGGSYYYTSYHMPPTVDATRNESASQANDFGVPSGGFNTNHFKHSSSEPDQFSTVDIPTSRDPNESSRTGSNRKQTPATRVKSSFRFDKKRLLLGSGIALAVTTLFSVGGYVGHREYQRHNQKALLEEIKALQQQNDNEECIAETLVFPNNFPYLHAQATNLLNACSQQIVTEAKDLAENNSLISAVNLTNQVPQEAIAAYQEVQEISEEWHSEVIDRAENQYKQCVASDGSNGFNNSLDWAGAIPNDSPVYETAQDKINSWQQEWTQNQTILVSAEGVMSDGEDWQAAEQEYNNLRILGESIPANSQCHNLPKFKLVTNRISDLKAKQRAEEAAEAARADAVRLEQEARERNPLTVSDASLFRGQQGILSLAEDGTLYRDYEISGTQGDTWKIIMRSADFDTRVYLIDDESGEEIAESDDEEGSRDRDSYIQSITLPRTGTYRVRANAFHTPPRGQGRYDLVVTGIDPDTNATVIGDSAFRKNVRAGTSTETPVLFELTVGSRVQVIDSRHNSDNYLWHKIYDPQSNREGWIAGQLVQRD